MARGNPPTNVGSTAGLGPVVAERGPLLERLRQCVSIDSALLLEAADEIEKLQGRVVGVGAVAINSVSRDQYPLPPVFGVYCCAENPNGLTLVFRRRPTEDDMRNLHDLVRAFGA